MERHWLVLGFSVFMLIGAWAKISEMNKKDKFKDESSESDSEDGGN